MLVGGFENKVGEVLDCLSFMFLNCICNALG